MWKTYRIPVESGGRLCNICYGLNPSVALERAKEEGKLVDDIVGRLADEHTVEEMVRFDHHVSISERDIHIIFPLSDLVSAADNCSSCWMLMRGIEDITDDRDDVTLGHGSLDTRELYVILAMIRLHSNQNTLNVTLSRVPRIHYRRWRGTKSIVKQLEYYTSFGRLLFFIFCC